MPQLPERQTKRGTPIVYDYGVIEELTAKLIEAESPYQPLSDEALAEIISRETYASRYAVAASRQQLNLPGSRARKREYKAKL